jgi:hypothetical protein
MTMSIEAGGQETPGTGAPEEREAGEVPAGYSPMGGYDRCDECEFWSGKGPGAKDSHLGDCLVHGTPPYIVEAGAWCPAWEPLGGDGPLMI